MDVHRTTRGMYFTSILLSQLSVLTAIPPEFLHPCNLKATNNDYESFMHMQQTSRSIKLTPAGTHVNARMTCSQSYPTRHICPLNKRLEHHRLATWVQVLLALRSGDIESNPGPYRPKYPCKICGKAAKWKQKCLQCDFCSGWYHAEWLGMPDSVYAEHEANTSISWICSEGCGMPQYWNMSSSLFNSESILPTSLTSQLPYPIQHCQLHLIHYLKHQTIADRQQPQHLLLTAIHHSIKLADTQTLGETTMKSL